MRTLAARDLLPHFAPDQVLEQCGYHEAGHALCFAIMGIRQDGITVSMRKKWFSRNYEYTALTHVSVEAQEAADQANLAVGILSGPAAEALYLSRNYRLDYDETLTWFMNHDISALQDMREFDDALSNTRPRYSRARAVRDTGSLVRRHWHRIERIANRAVARGYLNGDQVRRLSGV